MFLVLNMMSINAFPNLLEAFIRIFLLRGKHIGRDEAIALLLRMCTRGD